MNTQETKLLIELITSADYKVRSYSGRGMYGSECVAVSCDDVLVFVAELVDVAHTAGEMDYIVHNNIIGMIHQDSLGRGSIAYWPSIKWQPEFITDEPEEDEDDE